MPRTDTRPEGRPAEAGHRPGRPQDRSGDETILATTLDLLAEHGYDRMTLDEIAARTGRAKTTLYRRWATKEDLVLAALRAAGPPPEVDALPDHGSLRVDLLAVVDSPWLGGPTRRLSLFRALVSAGRSSPRLAEAVRAEVTDPYIAVYHGLLQRALDRGLIPAGRAAAVPLLAQVVPAMSTHGLNVAHAPLDRDFFVDLVDEVLLAALHVDTS